MTEQDESRRWQAKAERDNVFQKVNTLREAAKCKARKSVTGRVKDQEWTFENEARLFVETKKEHDVDHIAIAVPDEVISSISFTLSPWLNEDEEELVKKAIRTSANKKHGKFRSIFNDERIYWRSFLSNGLQC